MNESIRKGTVLQWDEPEANINPRLMPDLVEIMLELVRSGYVHVRRGWLTMKRSEMKRFIHSLNTNDKAHVIGLLLDNNPDLTKIIYDTAMGVVVGMDSGCIESDVYSELNRLDLDDLSGRSGRTEYGYVDPHDAAWGMFEEALDPFINEMKKNQERALPAVAKTHCIGIIKGLMRYDKDPNDDFKDWVIDAPGEYIDTVIYEWKKGNPSDEDIAEVMGFVKSGQS